MGEPDVERLKDSISLPQFVAWCEYLGRDPRHEWHSVLQRAALLNMLASALGAKSTKLEDYLPNSAGGVERRGQTPEEQIRIMRAVMETLGGPV